MNAVVCAPGLMKVSFVSLQSEEFHIYTQYCTNYPRYGLERSGVLLTLFCFKSLDEVSGTVCLALCWRPGKCKNAENGLWGSQVLFGAFWTGRIRGAGVGKNHEQLWIRPGTSLHSSKGKLIYPCCCTGLSTSLLTFYYVCLILKMYLCNITGKKRSSGFAW